MEVQLALSVVMLRLYEPKLLELISFFYFYNEGVVTAWILATDFIYIDIYCTWSHLNSCQP